MPDAETIAVLRAVLEELCAEVALEDTATRTGVASTLLAATRRGRQSVDELREAGKAALRSPPSMWR
ncbi:hypothetical protein [Bradyrhizobium sp.]|uniref:hypothetical protein n=1 Tax=Bradyrhizobium sp. TaxID=376 RepID=UPI00261934EB|nr:hypothetical protein [Bradyrhizobium sp.]